MAECIKALSLLYGNLRRFKPIQRFTKFVHLWGCCKIHSIQELWDPFSWEAFSAWGRSVLGPKVCLKYLIFEQDRLDQKPRPSIILGLNKKWCIIKQTNLAKWWIHPSFLNWVIIASMKGNPVRASFQAFSISSLSCLQGICLQIRL